MIEHAWDSVVCGIDGPVILGVWTGKPAQASDIRALVGAIVRHTEGSRAEGSRFAIIAGIPANMPVPSTEAREAIAVEMRRLDPILGCGVTVIPHKGFAGSALRAILSTLQLLSRPSHPESVVSSIQEAAAIVSRFVASDRRLGSATPERIVRSYEALCAKGWSAV